MAIRAINRCFFANLDCSIIILLQVSIRSSVRFNKFHKVIESSNRVKVLFYSEFQQFALLILTKLFV